MRLEEAIEIQSVYIRGHGVDQYKLTDAIKLGIEALKYRLGLEQEDPEITLEPLPGETE